MKLLFDFFPIFCFFIAYKFFGIYPATAVAMGASVIQVGCFWFKHRRFEITHIITLVLIIVLGSATLFLHNPVFIKWKPTAIYWVLALLFLGSQFSGNPVLKRLMGSKITLPQLIWNRLNTCWVIFFSVLGLVNIYVAYHYSTNTWVNFKLFGILGCTLVFGIIQSLYMAKYLESSETGEVPKRP